MNSQKSARFAFVLFVVFLLIQIGLGGMAYMEWVGYEQQENNDWNMHFAGGVFIGLAAIITFVLLYAQTLINARSLKDESKKLRQYQNAQVVRNIVGTIPAATGYVGILITGYWPFFIISGVSVLLHLAYLPTHNRLRRSLRMQRVS